MAQRARTFATPSADYADPAEVVDAAQDMTDAQLKCYGLTRHAWDDVAWWVEPDTLAECIRWVCLRCQRVRVSEYGWGVDTKHRYRDADDDTAPKYGVQGLGARIGTDGREAVRMLAVERVRARHGGKVPAKRGASEPVPISSARSKRRRGNAKPIRGKSSTAGAARKAARARAK